MNDWEQVRRKAGVAFFIGLAILPLAFFHPIGLIGIVGIAAGCLVELISSER